jgi:membrane protein DedA with SNARE-associated domain
LETHLPNLGSVTYGAVFLSVLAEYIGVPIPSSAVLILAGALAAEGHLNLSVVFLMALVAATLGDGLWFIVGRLRGEIFIKGYCALSLGSRDCVRRTKELFLRFPRMSLLLGKFVPALSTFVVPIAGYLGTGYAEFLRYDTGGIFLWASSMIAIGYGSEEWIRTYTGSVAHSKWLILSVLVVLLVCFYAIKLWRLRKYGQAEIVGEAE